MSATAPDEPEPVTAHVRVEANLIVEMAGVRQCDICGRLPLARKGCYASFRFGFVYVEACHRCTSLVKRAVGALE